MSATLWVKTNPSKLNECVEDCKETACEADSNLKKGCNQMYSCTHGCKMRELGVEEVKCKEHCNGNGQSGCSPAVNDYQFALCSACTRDGCSKFPTMDECEIGCSSYGKPTKLERCLETCKQTACEPDSSLTRGCSQMYSCSHACKIRDLGVKEDQCKEHCNRNGTSGCSPAVNGYQFTLCGPCRREGCSTWPTIDECEIGCTSYAPPADCEWNDWKIGECSKTCGGGSRNNSRTKKVEEGNGAVCEGDATMQEECNTNNCPQIHCKWDEWVYGECSKTCGTGTRNNTRSKLVVEEHGGTCTGQPTEVDECNTGPCPIDCEWDEWNIGVCNKPCGGGTRTNTREPKVDKEHGGENCTGASTVTESCNVQECPVDCKWGDWTIGECSKTCGDGVQTDIREKTQEELFGGKPCEGQSTNETECNIEDCPRIFRFNETCCEINGVPEECMGLCREKTDRAAQIILPIDRCAEHQETIKSCIYEEVEGGECKDLATTSKCNYSFIAKLCRRSWAKTNCKKTCGFCE